jgi:hypothetical protein
MPEKTEQFSVRWPIRIVKILDKRRRKQRRSRSVELLLMFEKKLACEESE